MILMYDFKKYILTENRMGCVRLWEIDMERLHRDVLRGLGVFLLLSFLGRPRVMVMMVCF